MLRSLDTETTGVDLHHGAKPFFVTSCDEEGNVTFFEWDVDPLTREPIIVEEDVDELAELLSPNETGEVVLQNTKFDVTALWKIRPEFGEYWRWEDTHDTLLSGHLLASNQPHDLTTMALVYLQVNIAPLEDALEKAVKEAKRIAEKQFPDWQLAKKNGKGMPSAKEKVWKYDSWLPRAVAQHLGYPSDHPWWTVLQEYANGDSEVTVELWKCHRALLEKRELWNIYQERRKILPVVFKMERRGVTIDQSRLDEIESKYREESASAGRLCTNIAKSVGYELELPKSGNNKSLTTFVFDKLKLPPMKLSAKTGAPSLDKVAIEHLATTLPDRSKGAAFIKSLQGKRKRDTALSYIESYHRFWLLVKDSTHRLHPSLNPTGTDTLRWSSANPNEQNISKQGMYEGDRRSLRYAFGPAPGREWWSLDYQNIELRIPAYESNERIMIDLFEKPDEPPYYGSYHLMNASIIYPDLFWPLAEQKGAFKKKYASTWYQWCKNFGFAISYGAMLESGTADRAAHKKGAQKLVMDRLKEHSKLNKSMIEHANRYGYVETIPDREVDPDRGYPVYCSRSNWGKISPTIPLNYHVQSTACWVVMRAMIKVQDYLDTLGGGYFIVMNVHDEIVLDFPYRPNKGNLPKIRKVKMLMGQVGDCIGVPLTTGVEYHINNWSEGVTC